MKGFAGAVLLILLVGAQHWEASTPLNDRPCNRTLRDLGVPSMVGRITRRLLPWDGLRTGTIESCAVYAAHDYALELGLVLEVRGGASYVPIDGGV